ncbi:MAG: hypothetical protein WC940_00005, partial [Candidatus Paceibacterota bacterium]
MNKTHYIILAIVLLVFIISPSLCDAQADSYNMDEVDYDDFGSEPDNANIGDSFTGPSGTTYVLKPESPTSEQQQDLDDADLNASGAWEPEEDNSNTSHRKDRDEWTCLTSTYNCVKSRSGYGTKAECQAHCKAPSLPPPTEDTYSCYQCRGMVCSLRHSNTPCRNNCRTNSDCRVSSSDSTKPPSATTNTYSCYQCRGTTCVLRYSSTYCRNNCRTNSDCRVSSSDSTKPPSTKPSSTTSSTITTTTTTVPPCTITKFELPNRAWVDIETTAS